MDIAAIAMPLPRQGGAMGEAGSAPIWPYLPELVFGVLVFAAFYWVVWKFVWPNMEKAYAARTAAIEGGIKEAEEAKAEAEAAREKYHTQLAGAHDEAAKIREDAKQQGAQIIAEMRQQAQTEAGRITQTAHKQVEVERAQAMVSLRGEVGRLSTDLAGRIVGESLEEEARQSGVVERFLAELEAGDIKPEKVGAARGDGDEGRGG